MNVWLLILLAGLVTFLTRLSFIALLDRIAMPAWFQRSLRFVPVAVLSAIILPELANGNGEPGNPVVYWQLFSGALAVLVAWRTKNVTWTIVAGMAALLVLQALWG